MGDRLLNALLELRAAATTPAQAAVLDLLPSSLLGRARMQERDDAVRAALAALGGSGVAPACDLERKLRRYLAGAEWAEDQVRGEAPKSGPELRRLLHRVAAGNCGRAIGWRQICRIGAGIRSPMS